MLGKQTVLSLTHFVLPSPIHTTHLCHMANIDQKFLDTIHEIGQHWGLATITKLTANVRRRKLRTTGDLIQSLDEETKSDLSTVVTAISIAFEEYGRFHDMKKNVWTAQPPVDELLKWIDKKGIGAFGPDPNPYKTKPKTTQRRKNEIAWGIARNRSINKGFKKRQWFQKPFYANLNALQEELLLGIADRSVEEIKDSLTDRLKRGGTTGRFF